MNCFSLNGIVKNCDSNVGGIRRAWIANYDDIQDVSTNTSALGASDDSAIDCEAHTINAIVQVNEKENPWKEYVFRKQTGSVTSTLTRDDAAGSLYYENVITLQFSKQESCKRMEINALAIGDLAVVIEDNNGKCWYFGYDFPVTLSDGSTETGTALGDMNGYTITLSDISKQLPYELSEDMIKKVKGISVVNG